MILGPILIENHSISVRDNQFYSVVTNAHTGSGCKLGPLFVTSVAKRPARNSVLYLIPLSSITTGTVTAHDVTLAVSIRPN